MYQKTTQKKFIAFPGVSIAKPQVAIGLSLYSSTKIIDLQVGTVSRMKKILRKYHFLVLLF